MKKTISIVLALSLILSMFAFTAVQAEESGCTHPNFVKNIIKKNATYHWYEVYCPDCDKVLDSSKEKHNFEDNICVDCKYEKGETCKHPDFVKNITKSNATYHWYEVYCPDCDTVLDSSKEKHNFENGICVDCGFEESCPHKTGIRSYVKTDSTYHYWEDRCADCGKLFESGKGKHEFKNGECWICHYSRECSHSNVIHKLVKTTSTKHYYKEICEACSKVLKKTSGKHTFENNKCTECGYEKKESDEHVHDITVWTSTGKGKHKGYCSKKNCDYSKTAKCTYVTLSDYFTDEEFDVCPLCGATSDGTQCMLNVATFKNKKTKNDITVNAYLNALTVCEDYCGKLQELSDMTIVLPSYFSETFFSIDGEEIEADTDDDGNIILKVSPEKGETVLVIDLY